MTKSESAALLSYLTGYVEAFQRPDNAESLGLYSFGTPVENWLPKVQTWAIRVPLFGPRGGLRTSALDIMKDIDQTVRGYFLSMTGRPNGGFLLVGQGDELITIEFR
jgi:hypothetical protein